MEILSDNLGTKLDITPEPEVLIHLKRGDTFRRHKVADLKGKLRVLIHLKRGDTFRPREKLSKHIIAMLVLIHLKRGDTFRLIDCAPAAKTSKGLNPLEAWRYFQTLGKGRQFVG